VLHLERGLGSLSALSTEKVFLGGRLDRRIGWEYIEALARGDEEGSLGVQAKFPDAAELSPVAGERGQQVAPKAFGEAFGLNVAGALPAGAGKRACLAL